MPPKKRAATSRIAIRIRIHNRQPPRRGRNGRSRPVLRFTRQAIRNISRLCPGIVKYALTEKRNCRDGVRYLMTGSSRDATDAGPREQTTVVLRSEERRVGKEWRSRWSP